MSPHVVKKPYFLLEQPETITDDRFNALLGRAVENPYKPIDGAFRPRVPMKPRDAIDYLYPSAYVICTDFEMVNQKTASTQISSKLQGLVEMSLKKGNAWDGKLSAAGFRRIRMENAPTMIKDLLREPNDATSLAAAAAKQKQLEARAEYRKQVLELLDEQEDRTLYIITGFITCSGLAKNQDRMRNTSVGLAAGTGPSGLAPYVDVDLGVNYSRTHDVGTKGAYDGEYLIACSYLPLYLDSNQAERKLTFGNLSVVWAKAGHDPGVVVGPKEVWQLGGSEAEGNMRATLGADDSHEDENPDRNEGEERAYDFFLVGHNGEDDEDDGNNGL